LALDILIRTRCGGTPLALFARLVFSVFQLFATTTMEALFGPVFPELKEALGDTAIIERSIIDPFDDPTITAAIDATGRKQLITAGVFVSVCACFPAVSARQRGYSSYVAIDASAAIDSLERHTSILRMTNAGVIVSVYGALIVEMLADNADPKAQAVYEAISSQFGVPTLASMRRPSSRWQPQGIQW
jgi:hypothetical protein